jgi:hypothetical protein
MGQILAIAEPSEAILGSDHRELGRAGCASRCHAESE